MLLPVAFSSLKDRIVSGLMRLTDRDAFPEFLYTELEFKWFPVRDQQMKKSMDAEPQCYQQQWLLLEYIAWDEWVTLLRKQWQVLAGNG